LVALRHGQVLAWLNGKFEGLRGARSMRGKADVAAFLEEGERQIRRLQGTRPDAYWAWYFRLTGAGGEK
jgi:broad specificity phosphatase PhoE